jgi:hypothetical protein
VFGRRLDGILSQAFYSILPSRSHPIPPTTHESTRSGCRAINLTAIIPPIEYPIMCAFLISR